MSNELKEHYRYPLKTVLMICDTVECVETTFQVPCRCGRCRAYENIGFSSSRLPFDMQQIDLRSSRRPVMVW